MKMIKILLIEDFEPDQEIFKRLINQVQNMSIQVDCVQSIVEAVNMLQQQKFDLIVSDLGLSDCVGLDCLKRLEQFFQTTPGIILTGYDDDSLIGEATQMGVYDYLVKGDLNPGILRRSLRYALARFEAEQEKNKLESQLRQSQRMDALGKLTGGIAHDFNNKLAVMSGNLQLLRRVNKNEKCEIFVNNIEKSIAKSAELIAQLLAFSRKQELIKKKVDLNSIVKDSFNLFDGILLSNIDLDVVFASRPAVVEVDPTQIDQVLMNLFINSQHAIGEKSGKISVTLEHMEIAEGFASRRESVEQGSYVRLSVEDNGSGMPPEVISKIFEPFYTTKEQGVGTGLGLSVVDGIIHQLGGFIDVSSVVGGGTAIHIYLKECVDNLSLVPREEKKVSSRHVDDCVVLYAEDDIELRNLTTLILEHRGFTIIKAEDGRHALEIFSERHGEIDVVLTDFTMPYISGKDLMIKVREICPKMGVVIFSGYSKRELAVDGILPRNTHFHSKPGDPDDIVQSLIDLSKREAIFNVA